MLQRRQVAASSGSSAPPAPSQAPGPSNTAYTPLKRRESANLYPTPSSANKARYPLPSPGLNTYISPSASTNNSLGLSSPINISGTPQGYGYVGPGPTGGGGGQYGAGRTYDLGGEQGGMGQRMDKGDLKELVMGTIRRGFEKGGRGVGDAMRLDRSWNLAWNDAELRLLILKSSLINLFALLLLSFFSVVVSPTLGSAMSHSKTTKDIGMWYNLLLSWPVFAVCFWSSWGPDISKRAQTLLHPSYRHQPSPASTPLKASNSLPSLSAPPDLSTLVSPLFKGVARLMLIADFTLMSRLISLVPLLGRPLGFAYMSIITGYYCFEWNFANKGWSLDHRVSYVQERTAYMIGFGLLPTLLTSLSTPQINMSIFALLYPFFVIQALVSRPPGLSSGLTSPGTSLPPTPTEVPGSGGNNPFFGERDSEGRSTGRWQDRLKGGVPLFVLARYGLEVLGWFEGAVGRKLGTGGRRERAGKRLG